MSAPTTDSPRRKYISGAAYKSKLELPQTVRALKPI